MFPRCRPFQFQVTSDIHLENQTFIPKISARAPTLFLCGDIGTLRESPDIIKYITFLENMSREFQDVIVVLGNHEYQSVRAARAADAMTATIFEGKMQATLLERYHNVTPLINRRITLHGREIFGGTLWTNAYASVVPLASHGRFIEKMREGRRASVERDRQSGCPDIVVSHHIPSMALNTHPGNPYTKYFFCDDLDDDPEIKWPKIWLCGHTHKPFDKIHRGTRFICNPLEGGADPEHVWTLD